MRVFKKLTNFGLQDYINENGMTPIKNVPGVNENETLWYINKNGEIIHIVRKYDNTNKINAHFDLLVCEMRIDSESHQKDKYVRVNVEGTKLIHRLLAATFLDMPYNSKLDVHHKDFSRNHNFLDNIEVLTHGDHMKKHFHYKKMIDNE